MDHFWKYGHSELTVAGGSTPIILCYLDLSSRWKGPNLYPPQQTANEKDDGTPGHAVGERGKADSGLR